MIVFPNSKINLGLHILEKRNDGYHELETLFYPLKLSGSLEAIPAPDNKTTLTFSGLPIPGDSQNNLCMKAYRQLQEHYKIPHVKIHLHKKTPVGAGLGGGSADGAYTLMLLNELFELKITEDQLKTMAAELGSDCPFFINNKPSLASGRGDILTPSSLNLKGLYLFLVVPPLHISTKEAYAGVVPNQPTHQLKEVVTLPLDQWKSKLTNDFEITIFRKHPGIQAVKQTLYDAGAVYASMSGSGSAIYGIFKQESPEQLRKDFSPYFTWQEKLD